MRLRWRVSTGLVLGLAVLGAAAPVGGAQGASTGVPQTPEAIRDYWTPERMREARPIEEALDDAGALLGGAEAGPVAKRGGAAAVPVRHRKRFPKRTHGKVYL